MKDEKAERRRERLRVVLEALHNTADGLFESAAGEEADAMIHLSVALDTLANAAEDSLAGDPVTLRRVEKAAYRAYTGKAKKKRRCYTLETVSARSAN